jgi:UDP-arabinose 4-epimerase
MKTVLVTGGAGYVGSHACKAFAAAGWRVVVYDSLVRGWADAVRWGPLIKGDLLDRPLLAATIDSHAPDLIAHFAAVAYVGESVENPALYYQTNTVGSAVLLDAMRAAGISRLLFSSTCATYGIPTQIPIDETHPQSPINPYGSSKLFVERMIFDHGRAYDLSSICLRYFNAAGADPDLEIGERHEPETHVIPLALRAALGNGEGFQLNGTDFDTRDGSAIRDYIHVSDLADAHVLAAEALLAAPTQRVYNLGTGTGTSLLELLDAIERVTGRKVSPIRAPRRPGDPAVLVASADRARRELGWTPSRSDIDTILATALAWEHKSAA